MSEVREGYKMTEFGEIPSDWKVSSLNDLTLEHKQGYYTKEPYVEEGTRLIRITDLANPKINYSNMPMLYISDTDYDLFKVEVNDFLFARSGAIGRYGIVKEDISAVFASYLIRFKFCNEKSTNDFIGYFYESNYIQGQIKKITQGSSNININANNIKSLKIALPSLKEQQKIASILSTIDKQIDETEQLSVKTKELKKGLMQQLLTKGIGHTEFKQTELGEVPAEWTVESLSSLGEWTGGGTPSKSDASNWSSEKEVLWVTSTDMHKTRISKTELYITEKGRVEKNLKLLPVNTLIFVMRSGILKRYLPVALAKKELTINQDQKAFTCNEMCTPLYIFYTIQAFNKQLRDTYVKTGTTVESIDFSGFKQFKLAIPQLQEQQKIASIISTVDDQIEVYEQIKVKYEELKKGLMQQLLTGQIRVKI